MALTGSQRRHLRALGHHLDALVQIGKHGLTDGVAGSLDAALETHELVKVRIHAEAPDDRHEAATMLAAHVKADVVQVLGRTLLFYRRHPNKPVIALPKT